MPKFEEYKTSSSVWLSFSKLLNSWTVFCSQGHQEYQFLRRIPISSFFSFLFSPLTRKNQHPPINLDLTQTSVANFNLFMFPMYWVPNQRKAWIMSQYPPILVNLSFQIKIPNWLTFYEILYISPDFIPPKQDKVTQFILSQTKNWTWEQEFRQEILQEPYGDSWIKPISELIHKT